MEQPNYFTIIPAVVRYDKDLTANAKLLYGELAALSNKKGVSWATNAYFAKLYNTSVISVSRWFSMLEKKGYIETKIKYDSEEKKVTKRLTRLLKFDKRLIKNDKGGIIKNDKGGIIKNVKDNSTGNNTNKTSKNNNVVFTDLEKECYKNIVPLFKEDYRPKTKAQKLNWI